MERNVRTVDDLLRLMDRMFAPDADRWTEHGGSAWWDRRYQDRSRPLPFCSTAAPDENLADYLDRGLLHPRRALDLGCGTGRNALHLAAQGTEVDAVDLSPTALARASERARAAGADICFHQGDAFALTGTALTGRYDLIYDSGCFHHLPPHRRISYLALLDQHLAPGGHFALTCFAAGVPDSGTERSDADLYRDGHLHGGLAYTPDQLRWIFSDLTPVEVRRMREQPPGAAHFGKSFLWTALFRRAPED
ncbi:class I SAM-dependent methyltransferase [Streptomyces sp. NPDC058045]|uniref:class I SAM-dependent methyltransferase n=1 Tax=Streptomyces sp. NPDC058045 TaxID=3346311 RepID=UPI0036E57592